MRKQYIKMRDAVVREASVIVAKKLTAELKKRQTALNESIAKFDKTLQKRVKTLVQEELKQQEK